MSFESEYAKLNPSQKKAVDTIEGPVIVIAGPGTGKTHVLTLRIANILRQSDIQPQNILALTFTDSAAKTMRVRLIELIGQAGYRVRIETFHALADSIIRQYPEFFSFKHDALPLTELEQYQIIHTLLENPELRFLRTPGSKFHYTKDIISAISMLKREGILPERFDKIVTDEVIWVESEHDTFKKSELLSWEKAIGNHQELAKLYTEYQKQLITTARYDFDDMLLATCKALQENELLLASLQEQFQYFLVDEYQDTNGAQNTLVDLLASYWGENANLFVVGDPNQTIFRFQGALLENTLGFLDRYPRATVITLDQGYRSNQIVYDTAHRIVSQTLIPPDHPLAHALTQVLRAHHTQGTIELHTAATDSDELLFLVEKIQSLLDSGVAASQIAILYKKNADGERIGELLSRAGIRFHTTQQNSVLQNPFLLQFCTLLRLIETLWDGSEYRHLFDVMGYDWLMQEERPQPVTILKLARSLRSQKKIDSPYDFVMQDAKVLRSLAPLKDVPLSEFAIIREIGTFLSAWSTQEAKLTFPAFVELVARESGFLSYLEKEKEKDALQDFIAVFSEIKKLAAAHHGYRLHDFLAYLSTMQTEGLKLPRIDSDDGSGVTLSTIHKAKGMEWEYVFLPFFHEGTWGKARVKQGLALPEGVVTHPLSQPPEADERRLLYVALTRAKHTAYVSFAQERNEQGISRTLLPSPYTTELCVPTTAFRATTEHLMIAPVHPTPRDAQVKSWLSTLVEHFPLSASSLNAYLEDPRLFFERYILKLPEAPQPHLAFGTAIHAALESYFKAYQKHENTHPPLEVALTVFDHTLRRDVLTPEDMERRLAQGHEVLTQYLREQKNTFPQILALEETFGWRRGKIMLGDIELTGKIDRMELTPEGNVRVMDYKTGRTKSLGDIEGTTKAAGLTPREQTLPPGIRGRMKRQLLFYKLLLSLDSKYRAFSVHEGVFSFVEPEKGKLITRVVPLLTEDVEELKKLIQTIMQEIRELQFL